MPKVLRIATIVVFAILAFYVMITLFFVFLVLVLIGVLYFVFLKYFAKKSGNNDTAEGVVIEHEAVVYEQDTQLEQDELFIPISNVDIAKEGSLQPIRSIKDSEDIEDGLRLSPVISSNLRYEIHWERRNGYGIENRYQFFKDGVVAAYGSKQGLEQGDVANNGIFMLMSNPSEELGGLLHVFAQDGAELFTFEFTANSIEQALSQSGRYASVATANSKTDHAQQLFLFDIEARQMLWKISPQSGAYPYKIEIDELAEVIILFVLEHDAPSLLEYRYTFDGEFLDAEKLRADRLQYSSPEQLHYMFKREVKDFLQTPHNNGAEIIDGLIKVTESASVENAIKASAFRLVGEMYENKNDVEKAIEYYTTALSLDEKVGVKRKLAQLQKII